MLVNFKTVYKNYLYYFSNGFKQWEIVYHPKRFGYTKVDYDKKKYFGYDCYNCFKEIKQ